MRKAKITSGHWHEVLDRTYLLVDVIERHLLDNPAVQSLPPRDPLRRKIYQAVTLLAEAYQAAGTKLSNTIDAEEAESNVSRTPRGQKRVKKKTQ